MPGTMVKAVIKKRKMGELETSSLVGHGMRYMIPWRSLESCDLVHSVV